MKQMDVLSLLSLKMKTKCEKMSNTFEFILLFYYRFDYKCICDEQEFLFVLFLSVRYHAVLIYYFLSHSAFQSFIVLSRQLAIGNAIIYPSVVRCSSWRKRKRNMREFNKIKLVSMLRMSQPVNLARIGSFVPQNCLNDIIIM